MLESDTCIHCGASITRIDGEMVGSFGMGSVPCWRSSKIAGQAWCSQMAGDGPPHAPGGVPVPDLTNPDAVKEWLS